MALTRGLPKLLGTVPPETWTFFQPDRILICGMDSLAFVEQALQVKQGRELEMSLQKSAKTAFELFDTESVGFLSPSQFIKAMCQVNGVFKSKSQKEVAVEVLSPKSPSPKGPTKRASAIEDSAQNVAANDNLLNVLLSAADKNQDGKIDQEEFSAALEEVMETLGWSREATLAALKKVLAQMADTPSNELSKNYANVKAQELISAIEDNNVTLVKTLLIRGADPNATDAASQHRLPLHVSAKLNNSETTTLLLQFTADPQLASTEMENAVEVAYHSFVSSPAARGSLDGSPFEIIVNRGGKLQPTSRLLFEAIRIDNVGCIHLLVRGGANLAVRDIKDRTAVDLAWEEELYDVFNALVFNGGQFWVHKKTAVEDAVQSVPDCEEIWHNVLKADANVLAEIEDEATPLHHAAQKCSAPVVDILASKAWTMLNAMTEEGDTPLDFAVVKERYDVAEVLVEKKGWMKTQRKTCLFAPIYNNDDHSVQTLMSGFADPYATNKYNETPLQLAVDRKNVAIVRILLSDVEGNPVDPLGQLLIQNRNGSTALHNAGVKGNVEVVTAILSAVGNRQDVLMPLLSHQNYREFTPLDSALQAESHAAANVMIKYGAKSHMIAESAIFEFINNKDLPTILSLVSDSTLLNVQDHRGYGVMHAAVAIGHQGITRALAEAKASTTAKTLFNGDLTIHVAVRHGQSEMINFLFKNQKFWDAFKILDGGVLNVESETALDLAFVDRKQDAAQTLLSNKVQLNKYKETGLYICIEAGETPWVEILLQGGADHTFVQSEDTRYVPLHVAALRGNGEACAILLRFEAAANPKAIGGSTPLHLVSEPDCVDALFNGKGDLRVKDDLLQSPLHRACSKGYPAVVARMLTVSADAGLRPDVNQLDINNNTAAHMASQVGCVDTMTSLMTHADIFPLLENMDGQTPLEVARSTNQFEVVRMLCGGGNSRRFKKQIMDLIPIEKKDKVETAYGPSTADDLVPGRKRHVVNLAPIERKVMDLS